MTSLEEIMSRAESGDCAASLDIATRFARGDGVERNIDEAEYWFRRASGNGSERPLYQLMRVLFAIDNDRIRHVFAEREEWQLAVIYLLFGAYLLKHGEEARGIEILNIGYRKGNIIAGVAYRARQVRKIYLIPFVIPPLTYLIIKYAYVKASNQNDTRIEHYI